MRSEIGALLLLIALVIAGISIPPGRVTADGHGSDYPYPGSGDWNITGYTYVGNESVVVNGNLSILSGGHLFLNNVTISINGARDGEFGVRIANGGRLTAINSTFMGPLMPPAFNYTFFADTGSTVTLTGCTFEHAGYKHQDIINQGVVIASDKLSISKTTFRRNYYGLILLGTKNKTLTTLRFENNTGGMVLAVAENITVENAVSLNNSVGLTLYLSNFSVIRKSLFWGNTVGVLVGGSKGSRLTMLNISRGYAGIITDLAENITFGPDITIEETEQGMVLNRSNKSTVFQNTLNHQTVGIALTNSFHNRIMANVVRNAIYGMGLFNSSMNEVGYNTILSITGGTKIYGMYLEDSSRNTVHNNTLAKITVSTDDVKGIYLLRSGNNTLYRNKIDSISAQRYAYGVMVQESSDNLLGGNEVRNISSTSTNGNLLFPWYALGIVAWEGSSRNTLTENIITNISTRAGISYSLGVLIGTLFKPERGNTLSENIISDVRCSEPTASTFGLGIINKADFTDVRKNRVTDVDAGAGASYGIYMDNVAGTRLEKNIVSKILSGPSGKSYGIYYKNTKNANMTGDSITGVSLSPEATNAFLIYLEGASGVNMEGVSVENGGIGIGLYKGSTNIQTANMTFRGISKQEIHALENSVLTVLNTTFSTFSITPGSKIIVQNFLHVAVIDPAGGGMIGGVRFVVKDNGKEISNTTTRDTGFSWVVVTNRIYFGDTNPRYNDTWVYLLWKGYIFDNHPRKVDTNTTHREEFHARFTRITIGVPSYNSSGDWYVSERTPFTLSLNYSGPATIYQYYAINSGMYKKYSGPFNLSGLSGKVKIDYYSSDGSVNIEDPRNITVTVDTSPPRTSHSVLGKAYGERPIYITSDARISLSAKDNESGVSGIRYAIDNLEWIDYNVPVEVKNFSPGAHTLRYYSIDMVENREGIHEITIYIDSSPPGSELTIGEPRYGTSPVYISENTQLMLNATDAGSGVSAIYYSVDSGTEVIYTAPFKISQNGSHMIRYHSIDMVGNTENEHAVELVVDAVPPIADAGKDLDVLLGSKITLSGTGSKDNVRIVNWTWKVVTPEDQTLVFYGMEVDLVCNRTGEYLIQLTVKDEVAHSGSDLIKINVRESKGVTGSGLVLLTLIILVLMIALLLIWYRNKKRKEKEKKEEEPRSPAESEKKEPAPPEKGPEPVEEGTPAPSPVITTVPEKDITRGMNNLVLTSDPKWCYEKFKELISQGAKGLCLSTTRPSKLRIRYRIQDASMYWLTDTSNEKDALNPRRIEFEVTKTVLEFMKGVQHGVVFIDGLEYLIMENGFERVTRFVKKICDTASKEEHTLIIVLNPSALAPDPLTVLKKNFDEIIER